MTIPDYPEFAPIGLEHKPEVDKAFSQIEPSISEFTFTNLFIWRHSYNISLSQRRGFILFFAQPPGKPPFFYPPWGQGNVAAVIEDCLQYLTDRGLSGHIERVPQDYIERHNIGALRQFEMTPDPSNDDYVYASQDLISLKGGRYDGKRNAIRKFQKAWAYEYRSIDRGLVPLCLALQDYWCRERHCELYPGLREEERAIREIFTNYDALGVRGGAILVGGRVAAFSAGEKLNKDTFVVHIEKANPEMPGLYAVINQQFIQNEASAYTYVNREQDLGDQGLRKAKQSYHAVLTVRKFKIGLKS